MKIEGFDTGRDAISGRIGDYVAALRRGLDAAGPEVRAEYAELGIIREVKGADAELSAELTRRVRDIFRGKSGIRADDIVVVVYDAMPRNAIHECLYNVGVDSTVIRGGLFDGAGIEVRCRKTARLMIDILDKPELAEHRGGVIRAFAHELMHRRFLLDDRLAYGVAISGTVAESAAGAIVDSVFEGGARKAAAANMAMRRYIAPGVGARMLMRAATMHYDDMPELYGTPLGNPKYTRDIYVGILPEVERLYTRLVEVLGKATTDVELGVDAAAQFSGLRRL